MFNRLTLSLTQLFLILLFTSGKPNCVLAQSSADAQFAVISTIRTLLPKFVERYQPGSLTVPTTPKIEAEEKPVLLVRRARRINAAYEGFVIELVATERPLLHDDPIFKKFGNIQYERTEAGKYAYLLQVPFSNKASVESFLENVIAPRMPDARIAEFKNGKLN